MRFSLDDPTIQEKIKELGNIYVPHHINDEGWLRYTAMNAKGEKITLPLCWVDAKFVALTLNNNQASPYLERLLQAKRDPGK